MKSKTTRHRMFFLDDLHIDHVVPVSRGGLTEPENLQTLCAPCNLRKGNRADGG